LGSFLINVVKKRYKMDRWTTPLFDRKSGQWLYGGAARNVRISEAGGMETILQRVANNAARMALDEANKLVSLGRGDRKVVALPPRPRRVA
jgi:hypothetical protein